MRLKTLLLGSAAAFAFAAGSAQAADLSVAEPVDYVRVCDAFGAGYWYIPGTDTCIAISGKVTFKMPFGDSDVETDDHTGSWGFETSTDLNVDARSMTDWGPLVAFIALTADQAPGGDSEFSIDEGYLSIGPVLMGYTDSAFDVAGGGYTNEWDFKLSDAKLNQVQLSWAFNGLGLAIGIEDPTDRFGSSADDMPALALALSTEMGGWEAAISFLYGPNNDDDTVAVEGVVSTEVGMWAFQVAGLWVDGDGLGGYGGNGDGGPLSNSSGVAFRASAQQNWTGQFSTAETIAWMDPDGGSSTWGFGVTAAYAIADSMTVFFDVGSEDEGDTIDFLLSAEVAFGPN